MGEGPDFSCLYNLWLGCITHREFTKNSDKDSQTQIYHMDVYYYIIEQDWLPFTT